MRVSKGLPDDFGGEVIRGTTHCPSSHFQKVLRQAKVSQFQIPVRNVITHHVCPFKMSGITKNCPFKMSGITKSVRPKCSERRTSPKTGGKGTS
jgi:hypothetical protein